MLSAGQVLSAGQMLSAREAMASISSGPPHAAAPEAGTGGAGQTLSFRARWQALLASGNSIVPTESASEPDAEATPLSDSKQSDPKQQSSIPASAIVVSSRTAPSNLSTHSITPQTNAKSCSSPDILLSLPQLSVPPRISTQKSSEIVSPSAISRASAGKASPVKANAEAYSSPLQATVSGVSAFAPVQVAQQLPVRADNPKLSFATGSTTESVEIAAGQGSVSSHPISAQSPEPKEPSAAIHASGTRVAPSVPHESEIPPPESADPFNAAESHAGSSLNTLAPAASPKVTAVPVQALRGDSYSPSAIAIQSPAVTHPAAPSRSQSAVAGNANPVSNAVRETMSSPAAQNGSSSKPILSSQRASSSNATAPQDRQQFASSILPVSLSNAPSIAPSIATPAHAAAPTVTTPSFDRNAASAPASPSQTFAALDAETSAPHTTWVHTGASRAEAGYLDPALGWVAVRADVAGSTLHASIVPSSTEAAQVLGTHLAGLNTYLADHHGTSAQLTIAAPESGQSSAGLDPSGRETSQQQQRDQQTFAASESSPSTSPRTADSSSALPAVGVELLAASVSSGGHISVMA
jgi:hypothetical protein